jgi:hypothetical protein
LAPLAVEGWNNSGRVHAYSSRASRSRLAPLHGTRATSAHDAGSLQITGEPLATLRTQNGHVIHSTQHTLRRYAAAQLDFHPLTSTARSTQHTAHSTPRSPSSRARSTLSCSSPLPLVGSRASSVGRMSSLCLGQDVEPLPGVGCRASSLGRISSARESGREVEERDDSSEDYVYCVLCTEYVLRTVYTLFCTNARRRVGHFNATNPNLWGPPQARQGR